MLDYNVDSCHFPGKTIVGDCYCQKSLMQNYHIPSLFAQRDYHQHMFLLLNFPPRKIRIFSSPSHSASTLSGSSFLRQNSSSATFCFLPTPVRGARKVIENLRLSVSSPLQCDEPEKLQKIDDFLFPLHTSARITKSYRKFKIDDFLFPPHISASTKVQGEFTTFCFLPIPV